MIPIWIYAGRRLGNELRSRQVPLLALSAAFSFVIMMFNVPIPGGSTGHAVGAAIIGIVLGPWAAVISVTVALVLLWALVPKLKTEASNQHQLLSQAAASQVGHYLGSFDSHLSLLVADIAAKSPVQPEQLEEMLDTVAQVQVGIEALYVVDSTYRVVAVDSAAGLWALAFAIYLVIYVPWLTRTRLDGKDG